MNKEYDNFDFVDKSKKKNCDLVFQLEAAPDGEKVIKIQL